MQSKRHKFLILELKFEDLITHNTVKIKQKNRLLQTDEA